MSGCHYCGTTTGELRPYGPGGSSLCFDCLTSDPEIEAAAGRAMMSQIEASEAVSDLGSSILTADGPNPLTDADTEQLEGLPWKEIT
ncbi:MAG: hypothetical protein GY925_03295 [Actinomycetia bacterium]|nr:hypothetical protein [Actinomycetes bacterium]